MASPVRFRVNDTLWILIVGNSATVILLSVKRWKWDSLFLEIFISWHLCGANVSRVYDLTHAELTMWGDRLPAVAKSNKGIPGVALTWNSPLTAMQIHMSKLYLFYCLHCHKENNEGGRFSSRGRDVHKLDPNTHTYTLTHIHIYISTHTHSYKHTHAFRYALTLSRTHTPKRTYVHTDTHINKHKHTHKQTHTHSLSYTHTHTYKHTHAFRHSISHTHKHTYVHTDTHK